MYRHWVSFGPFASCFLLDTGMRIRCTMRRSAWQAFKYFRFRETRTCMWYAMMSVYRNYVQSMLMHSHTLPTFVRVSAGRVNSAFRSYFVDVCSTDAEIRLLTVSEKCELIVVACMQNRHPEPKKSHKPVRNIVENVHIDVRHAFSLTDSEQKRVLQDTRAIRICMRGASMLQCPVLPSMRINHIHPSMLDQISSCEPDACSAAGTSIGNFAWGETNS